MKHELAVILEGGDNMLADHQIVTVAYYKDSKEVDRFSATLDDLAICGFLDDTVDDRKTYLKVKSLLAKQLH